MISRSCFLSDLLDVTGTKNSSSVRLKTELPFATFVALVQHRKKSAPVKIRTSNLLIRSQMLYPVELRALRAG